MNKIDELEVRCNEATFDPGGQVAYIDVVDLYRLLAVVRAAETYALDNTVTKRNRLLKALAALEGGND